MKLFAEDNEISPKKAVSRAKSIEVHWVEYNNRLFRVKKYNGKRISMERTLYTKDDIKKVNYESDEEYFAEYGKLRYVCRNHGEGLESLINFLNYQPKLKTFKKIEVHEIEFGRLQFRVEKYGRGTTIERIFKVKTDV